MSNASNACERTSATDGLRGQISLAGIAIGCVGCIVITSSSVYTALKMGSLPWPTIFTSVTALILLRALGRTSINEANITQVIMSAGSMVAGGLAFTIPGAWILGCAEEVSWQEMLGVAFAGTLLGLVATALIRRRFVDESDLEYPIGKAAAETLLASRAGGRTGRSLLGAMGLAGAWCVLRDALAVVPSIAAPVAIPGVAFGIQCSPMRFAIGFLAGRRSVVFWISGAVFGWIGLVACGSSVGLWDIGFAQGVVTSLGMGLMMGSGAGVVLKDVLWGGVGSFWAARRHRAGLGARKVPSKGRRAARARRLDAGFLALLAATAALICCFILHLGAAASMAIVALSFVTAAMSAQSVGQSGIDPMEIFGLIVLLFVAAFAHVTQVQLFFVAGVVAVACGLAGDVMSDFKTGRIIGTDPRTLWVGQAIGALLGAVAAVAVMLALVAAYGEGAFGPDGLFVAAQANVVATMVSGIPSIPAFIAGLVGGCALYCAGIPAMMIGLGVYLPFYMSFTTALGALIRIVWERFGKRSGGSAEERGAVVASGVIGGESIVGVIVALASVISGLAG